MAKHKILGTDISDLSFGQTVSEINKFIKEKKKGFVVTANPEILYRAYKNKDYQKIINNAFLVTPDGAGVLFAAKRKEVSIKERVTGIDLVWALAKLSETEKYKIYLLGGEPAKNNTEEVAKIAAERLKLIHPKIEIVGATYGFWKEKGSEKQVIKDIQNTKPHLLFVAFGPPKQEKWIAENLDKFEAPLIAVGIGGAFDMIAEKFKRAPLWMQKNGLEWLYRVIQEPNRIPRLWNVLKFIILSLF
ncbi:WecB/TagA/CpsF family glycosyltransferase [Patescibacteria group bacterium]